MPGDIFRYLITDIFIYAGGTTPLYSNIEDICDAAEGSMLHEFTIRPPEISHRRDRPFSMLIRAFAHFYPVILRFYYSLAGGSCRIGQTFYWLEEARPRCRLKLYARYAASTA